MLILGYDRLKKGQKYPETLKPPAEARKGRKCLNKGL